MSSDTTGRRPHVPVRFVTGSDDDRHPSPAAVSPLDDLVAETDSGRALEALRTALTRWKITADELPALFVAARAHRIDETLEEFQDSISLRGGLPQADRDIAVLFFKNETLMTFVVYFLWHCPNEIRNLTILLDPVMGAGEFFDEQNQVEPPRNELAARWSAAEDAYHASVMDNAARVMSAVFARPRSTKPPRCHGLRTRGRTRPAPRRREHRSTRRRASASRAGPDDPAEPAPALALAGNHNEAAA